MSNKEIVEDLLQRLPENTSFQNIAREIEFIAGVREGLAELDRAEGIPIEDFERELPSWIIRYRLSIWPRGLARHCPLCRRATARHR